MPTISPERFPPLGNTVRAVWAPVFLSPILGSPEQLVIAVAAANDQGFHIETANAISRLKALYGDSAETVLFASEVAIEQLTSALSSSGPKALVEGALVFSGVRVGRVGRGESASLKRLAATWMGALSSLYRAEPASAATDDTGDDRSTDRLPILVHHEVQIRKPSLASYFSDDIRSRRQRRSKPAGISIDYAGQHIVANFATLITAEQARSVDLIKRKMFDLIVRREQEATSLLPRTHEMIVFSPGAGSPMATERQAAALREAHDELAAQSRREEVEFGAYSEVPHICGRLVRAEAVAT